MNIENYRNYIYILSRLIIPSNFFLEFEYLYHGEYMLRVNKLFEIRSILNELMTDRVDTNTVTFEDYLEHRKIVQSLEKMIESYGTYKTEYSYNPLKDRNDSIRRSNYSYERHRDFHTISVDWKEVFDENERSEYCKPFENIIAICDKLDESYEELENCCGIAIEQIVKTIKKYLKFVEQDGPKYADIIANSFYNFADIYEEELESDLYDEVYEKVIKDYSKEPTNSDFAVLLREKLGSIAEDAKFGIIREVQDLRRPLDIKHEKIINHLYKNCIIQADLELFFANFLEIHILKCKTRPSTACSIRPLPEEEVVNLPDEVVDWIRNDARLSKQFKEAIKRFVDAMGPSNKTKPAHLKKMLEDEGLVIEMNFAQFGRFINAIVPSKTNTSIEKAVGSDNQIKEEDRKKKYFNLEETNGVRTICTKCKNSYFADIIARRP